MEKVVEHILMEAEKLFMKFGMRSVTMDDIAKHLGMSKKTIYANFKDKDDLVMNLFTMILEKDHCSMTACTDSANNAIEEIFLIMNSVKEILVGINPIVFYDLEKYHNKAYQMMMDFHQTHIYNSVKRCLERGITENIFRSEINTEILSTARVAQINWVFQSDLIRNGKFTMYQVFMELTINFLLGISTLSGQVLINNYTNNNRIIKPYNEN